MGEFLSQFISNASDFVWGAPMIAMITVTGIYISFRSRFFQLTHLKQAFIAAFKGSAKKGKNGISPFQSVCTALSATMGTGNIAGVAGAIALGGPGAVFWMWVSALLGMSVKLAEVILACLYRQREKGDIGGGPMYYIKYGLPKVFLPLSYLFSFCGIAAMLGTGSTVQINTMVQSITEVSKTAPDSAAGFWLRLAVGALSGILCAVLLSGGAKRIGAFTEKATPFMIIFFAVLSLGVIAVNIRKLPLIFAEIFKGAFCPASVTGGVIGYASLPLRFGFSRGIFSNEAGMGTAPIAYASAEGSSPLRLGLLGVFEVFADTLIMCTLTALVILCTAPVSYGQAAGAELTLRAFESVYGKGISVPFCLMVCMLALSSVIGWSLYGQKCAAFIFGDASKKAVIILMLICCVAGAFINAPLLWQFSELFNGIMALPNLIAVLLLSERVFDEIKAVSQR